MNKAFLETLLKKLQGRNNLRSIYLNCIPGRLFNRLDIFDLDNEVVSEDNWANEFLSNLLEKKSFKKKISLKPKCHKIENHFFRRRKSKKIVKENEKNRIQIYKFR